MKAERPSEAAPAPSRSQLPSSRPCRTLPVLQRGEELYVPRLLNGAAWLGSAGDQLVLVNHLQTKPLPSPRASSAAPRRERHGS